MRTLKSIVFTICLALAISSSLHASTIVFGTIEIKADSKKAADKYSLKNLGSLTHKTSTFYTLKSSLEFKGINTNAGISSANYLKYNKGNISYVIPYRYKMVLPKFKTPTPVLP